MKYTYIDIQFPVDDVSKVILFEAMIRLLVKVCRWMNDTFETY